MPRSCKTQIRYGRGTINPARNGTSFRAFMHVDGKSYRAQKKTLIEARAWLDMIEDQTQANRPPLTKIQMSEAAHALAILPQGIGLVEAARIVAGMNTEAAAKQTPILDALDAFLAARAMTAQAITLTSYRHTVSRLDRIVGGTVQSVTPASLEMFLADLKPINRNGQLRNLAAFFNWCQREGLITVSPTAKVQKARAPEPPKGVLTVQEVRALMAQAETDAPEIVPYLAIGFFAGLRPGEIGRIATPQPRAKFIAISGSMAKGAYARTVTIRPNLRAWLDAYPTEPAHGLKRAREYTISELCKSAGVTWKHDAARHSFCTYAFEESKNAAEIAAETGHSVAIFFRHYRAMSLPGDGKKFFAIMPKKKTRP